MRPLTDHTPKPLLPVAGKPLIVWHLEKLQRAGITQVVINTAHLGHKIRQTLGDGRAWNLHIQYSNETPGQALETAGGICKALPLLGKQPFLLLNGDVYSSVDYAALKLQQNDLAHLVMVDNPCHHLQGDFVLRDGRLRTEGAPRLTYSGIGVYSPELFASCKADVAAPLAPVLREAMQGDRVSGEYFAGYWLDVGTPARYHQLKEDLKHGSGNQ